MTRRGWALLGAFVAPLLLRGLWFYQGAYVRPAPVATPDYTALHQAAPPLGTPVEAPQTGTAHRVVLVDWAHQNQFTVPELGVLTAEVAARGARLEVVSLSYDGTALPLEERLKYADAYLVAAPVAEFTPGEVRAVAHFVQRGGHLLVISDPTRGSVAFDPYGFYFGPTFGDVAVANGLLAPYDLTFGDDYLYNLAKNEGNYRNVFLRGAGNQPLTSGVAYAALYGARSVHTNTGTLLLLGNPYTYSSRTDAGGGLAAAAISADGNVLALGDMTFLVPPYHQVLGNGHLIQNLAGFLAAAGRPRDLEDFPYVFTQSIEIVESDGFPLTADHLRALAGAQTALGSLGQDVRLSTDASRDLDLVMFALLGNTQAVSAQLSSLGVTLPSESEDGKLILPGFPPLDPTGVGILLLAVSDSGNTLLLMAESSSDLSSTFDLVTQRDLSACFVRGTAAVCQVGSGDFLDTSGGLFGDFGGDLFTPTPGP